MIRTIFIATFVANLILGVVTYNLCPDEVASHFGAGGEADARGSSLVNMLVMGAVHCAIFLLFFFIPTLMRVIPKSMINLPNKDYWLSAENKERAIALFSKEMYAFGAATLAFMFVTGLLTLQANLSDPVRMNVAVFWSAFVIFMVFSVFWVIRLLLKFNKTGEERY